MVNKTTEIVEVLLSLWPEEELLDLKDTTKMLSDIKGILDSTYPDEGWRISEIRTAVKDMIEYQRRLKMHDFETRLCQLANSYGFVASSIRSLEKPDEEIDDPIKTSYLDILIVLNKELSSIAVEFSHFNKRLNN